MGYRALVTGLVDLFSFEHLGRDAETNELLAPLLLEGREGVVVHLEYSCGCGQSYPGDPMIGVCMYIPGRGYIVEEFWFEELDFAPAPMLLEGPTANDNSGLPPYIPHPFRKAQETTRATE